MAQDKGIDLSKVNGSGENGRVVKKDIESYEPAKSQPAEQTKAEETKKTPKPESKPVEIYKPVGEEEFEGVKNSQMRKVITKRLAESKFNAPHYYLDIEVDMDNAMVSRKQINEIPDAKISFNDLVIKALAMALRKHPQVNSQ